MQQLNARLGRRSPVLGMAVGAVLLAFVLMPSHDRPALRELRVTNMVSASDVATLARMSEAIAVVQVGGPTREHWNSADGNEWGDAAATSFIYRDTPVHLVRTIRGNVPKDLNLRLVGGTADGVHMDFEGGGPPLIEGETYVVFLEQRDFPTKEGFETSWTAVRLGQGVFAKASDGWRDQLQDLRMTDAQVSALAQ